jgi:hypothetical protein
MRKILVFRRALRDSLQRRANRTKRHLLSRFNDSGRFVGCIEKVRHRTVFGWACDTSEPERPVSVRFEINGIEAGIAAANHYRPDIAKTQYGFGMAGFEFPVPDYLGDIETVRAFALEGDIELPAVSEDIIQQGVNRGLPAEWIAGRRFRLPSFFLLGVAKSGTTSLHAYLAQHQQICMSHPKEPFFFEAEFERGPAYYFNRYFSHWNGEQIVGESRHRNLYLPSIPERLWNYNPEARLLVILRNPVERAISHWWHWYARCVEALPLRQALEADLKRIEAGYRFETENERQVYRDSLRKDGSSCFRTYLDSGYYLQQIERYTVLFSREQLRVVLFDDLVGDPRNVVRETCEFVGADPEIAGEINYLPVNRSDAEVFRHVDRDSVSWLLEHYRAHNARLQDFLGRSLLHWNRPFEKRGQVRVAQAAYG